MKKYVAFLLWSPMASAIAQSGVQIYGWLDVGPSYISNTGGHSLTKLDDGIYLPSVIGFRGTEDLGGGLQALFHLETQLAIAEGSVLPDSTNYFRQSYVGLKSASLGRVTLGNQFDFMYDNMGPSLNDPAIWSGGFYSFAAGPFSKLGIPNNLTGALGWDRTHGERVHNAVKYVSPAFGGLQLGALYAFGEGVSGRTVSFGANYANGPFGVGAAYTEVKYGALAPTDTTIRTYGLGSHYGFGSVIASAMATAAKNVQSGAFVYQGKVGATWNFSGPWSIGGSYAYMKGNEELDNNHAHQLGLLLSYAFSKRTMVYLQGIYQKTNSTAHAHIMGIMDPNGASSTSNQSIVRLGLKTEF